MDLILASASPRRRELLHEIAPTFSVVPSAFEERGALGAEDTALAFARGKAEDVFAQYPDALVLGADTVVALEGKVFGKPHTREEAYAMLRALSGKTHSVFTGVCLVKAGARREGVVETKVTFLELSDAFLDAYIESGSPFDKAGGYGIQDGGLVQTIEGSYTNVVGLPLETVKRFLEELGGRS